MGQRVFSIQCHGALQNLTGLIVRSVSDSVGPHFIKTLGFLGGLVRSRSPEPLRYPYPDNRGHLEREDAQGGHHPALQESESRYRGRLFNRKQQRWGRGGRRRRFGEVAQIGKHLAR